MFEQAFLIGPVAGCGDDRRYDLAPFGVQATDHGTLENSPVAVEDTFHLKWIHVKPAGNDQFRRTAAQLKIPFSVD